MLAIFIGSFNPPTKAHLDIALKLQEDYEKIIFVPVNSTTKYLAPFINRVEMLSIYTNRYKSFSISKIMQDYSYFNFRILDLLKSIYGNIDIIIGYDLLENLYKFDNYEYLLENFYFVVVPRYNKDVKTLIKEKYFNYQNKFRILDYFSNINSTDARNLIKECKNPKDLLDSEVINYINNHHLYF